MPVKGGPSLLKSPSPPETLSSLRQCLLKVPAQKSPSFLFAGVQVGRLPEAPTDRLMKSFTLSRRMPLKSWYLRVSCGLRYRADRRIDPVSSGICRALVGLRRRPPSDPPCGFVALFQSIHPHHEEISTSGSSTIRSLVSFLPNRINLLKWRCAILFTH